MRAEPAGGFVYARRQNNKGEEVGGIVPHVTLKSIANNEKADEEVLVDRPENNKIVRVTGPFASRRRFRRRWTGKATASKARAAEKAGDLRVVRRAHD